MNRIYSINVGEDIARLAMAAGFPLEKVTVQYTEQPPLYYTVPKGKSGWADCDAYYIPTAEQVVNWLREEHGIIVTVGYTRFSDYEYKGVAYRITDPAYAKAYQWHTYRLTLLGIIRDAISMVHSDQCDTCPDNQEYMNGGECHCSKIEG